jgi:hypothetical protein
MQYVPQKNFDMWKIDLGENFSTFLKIILLGNVEAAKVVGYK